MYLCNQKLINLCDMKKLLLPILLLAPVLCMALTEGHFVVKTVAPNAVRIRYVAGADTAQSLPDWLYVKHEAVGGRWK